MMTSERIICHSHPESALTEVRRIDARPGHLPQPPKTLPHPGDNSLHHRYTLHQGLHHFHGEETLKHLLSLPQPTTRAGAAILPVV